MADYQSFPYTVGRTQMNLRYDRKRRIGVVRPDPHGLLYAYCLDHCQRRDFIEAGGQIYIMDNGIAPVVPWTGTCIAGVCREMSRPSPNWKPEHYQEVLREAETASWTPEAFAKCFDCPIYDTVEEMADPEKFDGILIGNCSWMAEDHVELAMPFIRAGIPIFIDKPFANNAKDAALLLKAAREYGTPVFSSSILYLDESHRRLKQKNLGRAHMIVSSFERPIDARKGSVHLLSNLLGAMRVCNGPDYRVESIRHIGSGAPAMTRDQEHHEAYAVTFSDGTVGILNNEGIGRYGFECTAFCQRGTSTEFVDIPDMRGGIVYISREFVNMVFTGDPPLDYDRIFEFVAVLDAGIRSRAENREVTIAEIAGEVGWVFGQRDHDPEARRYIERERGGRG